MRLLARSARNSPKASKRTAFTAATATRMPRSKSPISSSLKKSSAKPQAEPKRRGRRIALAAFFVSEFVGHAHQSRQLLRRHRQPALAQPLADRIPVGVAQIEPHPDPARSAEHTSELQSLMRISYPV